MHLVRRGHFRSHDKDGGGHTSHKLHCSIFYRTRLMADQKLLHCGNRVFSCDLDLDSLTFICELDSYRLKMYSQTTNELFASFESYVTDT